MAADSFTELECEGKEAPSHAWNGRTAHSNDLERCWPSGANPRTDRKEVGETHASSRAWPPHAHFRRTHVSARTLLALYNQARLAYLEKAKRPASAESHLCVRPGWFRATALAEPRPEHSTLGLPRVTTSTFGLKSGPCPASYKAVHGWAELVADHATAGFGLPMAQTPLPVADGMRCRCSIVSSFSPF